MTLAEGSLCTGYNGLGQAVAAVTGARLAFTADPDPGAATLLAHRYPGTPNLGDITTVDWAAAPHVDILTAGYPCQPFSQLGHRKGPADERHLWPAVADGIRHLRPGHVYLENVPNHLSLGFGNVLATLATLGYVGSWRCVRASHVGAPHDRDRVFIYACQPDAEPLTIREQPLPVFARVPELLPTPRASPNENRQTKRTPSQEAGKHGRSLAAEVCSLAPGQWGIYEPAVSRWETLTGRWAPAPVHDGRNGRQLAAAFSEWMMGLENGWVTAVPGLTREQQLRLLGNGVVPQQGAHALRLLAGSRKLVMS